MQSRPRRFRNDPHSRAAGFCCPAFLPPFFRARVTLSDIERNRRKRSRDRIGVVLVDPYFSMMRAIILKLSIHFVQISDHLSRYLTHARYCCIVATIISDFSLSFPIYRVIHSCSADKIYRKYDSNVCSYMCNVLKPCLDINKMKEIEMQRGCHNLRKNKEIKGT